MEIEIKQEGYQMYEVDNQIILIHPDMLGSKIFNSILKAYEWAMCITD